MHRFIALVAIAIHRIHRFSSLSERVKRGKRAWRSASVGIEYVRKFTFYNDLEYTLKRMGGAEGRREHVDGRAEASKPRTRLFLGDRLQGHLRALE